MTAMTDRNDYENGYSYPNIVEVPVKWKIFTYSPL